MAKSKKMSPEVIAKLRALPKKLSKKQQVALVHQDEAHWSAAIDWVLEHPGELPVASRNDFKSTWRWSGKEEPRNAAAAYVRVKQANWARPWQLEALTEHFGSRWVYVSVYNPDDGEEDYYRRVEVWPAREVLGVLRFLGVKSSKYLVGYTQTFVTKSARLPEGGHIMT